MKMVLKPGSILLLAALAAAPALALDDEDVRELLRSTVVMIDPSLNPDGYGRFSTWANHAAGRVPARASIPEARGPRLGRAAHRRRGPR